jgi:hypothetical protein
MSSLNSTSTRRRTSSRSRTEPVENNVHNNPYNNTALDTLNQTQMLFVKQHVEMMEAITGWETANEYTVLDQAGRPMYHCQEESGACMRQCCKSNRSFNLHIKDTNNNPVLLIERPYRFFWQEILIRDVSCGNGFDSTVLGTVQRSCSFCSRDFIVINAQGQKLFKISSGLFSPWSFYVYDTRTGAEIGIIQKKWSGLAQELFTDADNFGIQYPRNLSKQQKALLMAATFLIDFMYFEDNDANSNRGRGRRGGMGFSTNMF